MRIYLDNCCFNRPYDDQGQLKIYLETQAKLAIQQEIENRNYDLVWSYILDAENADNPFQEKKSRIAEWKALAIDDCGRSQEVVNTASELTKIGIKPKDALHISCAIHSKCSYFITTDAKLLNKEVTNIEIVDPVEFIRREYNE